jgi:hypothetical protein
MKIIDVRMLLVLFTEGRDSLVSVTTGYRLDDRGVGVPVALV